VFYIPYYSQIRLACNLLDVSVLIECHRTNFMNNMPDNKHLHYLGNIYIYIYIYILYIIRSRNNKMSYSIDKVLSLCEEAKFNEDKYATN